MQIGAALLLVMGVTVRGQVRGGGTRMEAYETPVYVVRTDLGADDAREACLRLTKLAEEYRARLKGVSPAVGTKLVAYLYRRAEDYEAAGGRPDARGNGDARALMAIAGDRANARTWNVVQHEAFHQWLRVATDRPAPPWVEEGVAEYLGEGIWCGDEFLTGVLPAWRVARLKEKLREKKVRPLVELVRLTRQKWGARGLSQTEYDQAWSVVHYLIEAGDGTYRQGLWNYLTQVAQGAATPDNAWSPNLPPVGRLESQWRTWVLGLGEDPTADVYARSACSTLSSFVARAAAKGQRFESWESFRAAAETGKLACDDRDWLPASLLRQGLDLAKQQGSWTLSEDGTRLQVKLDGGKAIVGTFELNGERVGRVWTEARD